MDEGTIIIYVDKIKLVKNHVNQSFKSNGSRQESRNLDVRGESFSTSGKEIFDLKYTTDCPKVEVDQLDPMMLKIDFFDNTEGFVKEKGFTRSIDLRALTRKSRDLIILSVRCFSALNNYKNAKIISMLNSEEEEKVDYKKLEITSIADLLLELDHVKRELYDQIDANDILKIERK